jgi:hypothetical protein
MLVITGTRIIRATRNLAEQEIVSYWTGWPGGFGALPLAKVFTTPEQVQQEFIYMDRLMSSSEAYFKIGFYDRGVRELTKDEVYKTQRA